MAESFGITTVRLLGYMKETGIKTNALEKFLVVMNYLDVM